MTVKKKMKTVIKESRLQAGLSQSELGKQLGYSSGQFISNWERGVSYPPMDRLAMIIKTFKLNKTVVLNQYIEEITENKLTEFKDAYNSISS